MTPRRILLINYEYPPVGGGGGNATEQIARAMARQGHTPFVLTAAWGDLPATEVKDGVTIRRIPALRRRADRCSIPEMAAFMASAMMCAPGYARHWRAEAALVFFAVPCGPIGWLLKRTNKLPYAISLQGGDVPGFDPEVMAGYHRVAGGLIRALWHDANLVVANSTGLANLARAHDAATNIGVIPAGADISGIAPKTDYGTGDDVHLLFVGRLVKQKGLDILLPALAKLSTLLPWRLTLVGDGPVWPALAGQAAQLGIADRIQLKGWVERPALPTIYRSADVFVLPSRDEGMPNALLEAMAAGLPVAGTRIAGTSEAVVDGETGLLAAAEDVDGLAAILDKLVRDATLRDSMGRAGRARVEARYSWMSVTAQWMAALEKIIPARTP